MLLFQQQIHRAPARENTPEWFLAVKVVAEDLGRRLENVQKGSYNPRSLDSLKKSAQFTILQLGKIDQRYYPQIPNLVATVDVLAEMCSKLNKSDLKWEDVNWKDIGEAVKRLSSSLEGAAKYAAATKAVPAPQAAKAVPAPQATKAVPVPEMSVVPDVLYRLGSRVTGFYSKLCEDSKSPFRVRGLGVKGGVAFGEAEQADLAVKTLNYMAKQGWVPSEKWDARKGEFKAGAKLSAEEEALFLSVSALFIVRGEPTARKTLAHLEGVDARNALGLMWSGVVKPVVGGKEVDAGPDLSGITSVMGLQTEASRKYWTNIHKYVTRGVGIRVDLDVVPKKVIA